MTTSMLAWHRTMRTPLNTSTERRAQFSGGPVVSSSSYTYTHRGSSSTCLRLSHHPHGHPRACVLFTLTLPFYLLLFLPPLFLFLTYMKSMVNLQNSAKEGVGNTDVPFLPTEIDVNSLLPFSVHLSACFALWWCSCLKLGRVCNPLQ